MMFSIIATDYDKSVSAEVLQRFLDSLKAQTFKDFEVIILHDGPRNHDLVVDTTGLNVKWYESLFRANVWGHNLRTYGMTRKAEGEYYINTNTDNVYYPDSLEKLNAEIEQYSNYKVFINHVKMMGMHKEEHSSGMKRIYYDKERDYSVYTILTGDPPIWGNIDLMSLVAHKDVWDSINYWYDLGTSSDGVIYQKMCHLFPYRNTSILIGEHY